jgi:hypothetical protein
VKRWGRFGGHPQLLRKELYMDSCGTAHGTR